MTVIKPYNPPAAEYAFGYKNPPISGNIINGLGETEKRRPRHIFHNPGNSSIEWGALNDFFTMINPWRVVMHLLGNLWFMRKRTGPVNPVQIKVDDAAAMAAHIKEKAKEFGADLVGITFLTDDEVFQDHSVPYKNVICMGMKMDREQMKYVPQEEAAVEVLRVYKEISRTAMKLATYIRGLGWPAKGYGDANSSDLIHIPLAVRAGFGQLGKHGSIINIEHGSNFRLAAVATDLPLTYDEPVDIGVDDLCMSCRRCVVDCPPYAIFDDKQMVRGVNKWYVDFDKCTPYFVKTYGCAICIQVCPWAIPGKGPILSEIMLAKRGK